MKKANKDIIDEFQSPFKYNSEDGYIFDANHKTFLDMGKVYDAHLWKAQRATALTIIKALNSQAVAEKILSEIKAYKNALPLELSANNTELNKLIEAALINVCNDVIKIFAENGVK